MDLNQKTLVSYKYCTGFVDCRRTNLQTVDTMPFLLLALKAAIFCLLYIFL